MEISEILSRFDGNPVMVDAEYADIPTDLFARFLLQKFGRDAIFNKGASN